MAPAPRAQTAVHRPRRARAAIGLVLAACLVAALVSYLERGPGITGVSLLPATSSTAHAWHWDARCPLEPATSRDCAREGPVLGEAQLNGDAWNLGTGSPSGSLAMSLDGPGELVIRGSLASAPPCTGRSCIAPSANTWVRGYPNVLYGINQCHADTSPPRSKALPLPVRVSAIKPDLIGTTEYARETGSVTFDIAYDMWLNKSDTRRPCRTNGTVEVMVWTDYDSRALLPPSMQVGTATIPFAVDGAINGGSSDWAVYASDIYGGGKTAPWGGTVWYVLNPSSEVSNGTVSVDLSAVLTSLGTLLDENYGWHDFGHNYFLDTIPFGMEFGPESGTLTGEGATDFSLRLSSYCLDVATVLSKATCAGLNP